MKRFFLKVLSVLFLIFCIFGGILAAAGFDDGSTGMAIAGCIIAAVMLLFFFLCLRKSKNHEESAEEVAPEESSPTNPKEALSDKFGIDYVVTVGRKRSVYIMMVHYKSGKVKRVRTRFDSLEFRHYAKYIKQ